MEGIINVLKPPGMTSNNVVADIKRLTKAKRVGHTGTLDPGAAGVLPVCLGRATRLFDLLVEKKKEYIAEIAFGACTDTQDSYGCVTRRDTRFVSEEELQAVLPSFVGKQIQIAPAYSALKHEGQPMYKIARSGGEVPEKRREIEIEACTLLGASGENRYLINLRCSRGTYVRVVCEEIGKKLSTCAHMSFLLRVATGAFRVEDAYTIQELSDLYGEGRLSEAILPVDQAVEFLPAVRVDAKEEEKLLQGCTVVIDKGQREALPESGLCRVYGAGFLGIGEQNKQALKLKIHLIGSMSGNVKETQDEPRD